MNNKIENLELVSRKKHMIEHNMFKGYNKKDMSMRFCNICKTKISKHGIRTAWFNDINGFLCRVCSEMIKYYQKKFGIR